jgi:hypothetical protein
VKYAGYVITGWVLTTGVLGVYWARLVVRIRRDRRELGRI